MIRGRSGRQAAAVGLGVWTSMAMTALGALGVLGTAAPARPAWAGEGFGALTQLSARMTRVSPPAVALPGNRIAVRAGGGEAANAALARRLAAQVASELFDRDQRLITDSQFPEVVVEVRVLQNRGADRWEQRQGVEVRRPGADASARQVLGMVSAPVDYRVVTHAVAVSYKVTDAVHGVPLDGDTLAVDFEQAFREGDGAPGAEQLQSAALTDLSRRIAGRLAPSRDAVEVLLPRGSLESLAPLATAGLWSRYLEGVEKRPRQTDPVAESYRQYALGTACEALGYAADSTAAALLYLERADIAYRAALDANPREKSFSQPYRGLLSTRTFAPPLERVRSSLLAYRRFKSQADALAASSRPVVPASALTGVPGLVPRSSLPAAATGAAIADPPIDNATVIRLVQAGLGEDIVLKAIESAPRCEFDVSVEGLIALSEARVDAAIIRRMQAMARMKVVRPLDAKRASAMPGAPRSSTPPAPP
jgi:hypothetical protein